MNRTYGFLPSLALLLIMTGPLAARAFPIALPGTEGQPVIVSGTDAVVATYQGNSASYSNDLFLMLVGLGNPGDDGDLSNDLFIFNNHASAVGSTVDLGSFAIGTELIFRLYVRNTGYNYYSGPASRNPDGQPHARVQSEWQPGTTLVSFEDLYGTPEGVNGYNDLSFSFTNTTSVIPEPASAVLFMVGFAVVGAACRRVAHA